MTTSARRLSACGEVRRILDQSALYSEAKIAFEQDVVNSIANKDGTAWAVCAFCMDAPSTHFVSAPGCVDPTLVCHECMEHGYKNAAGPRKCLKGFCTNYHLYNASEGFPVNQTAKQWADNTFTDCPHRCGGMFRMDTLVHHIKTCAERLVATCPNDCSMHLGKIPFRGMMQHAERDCPRRLVACPLCEMKVPYEDLHSHLSEVTDDGQLAHKDCLGHAMLTQTEELANMRKIVENQTRDIAEMRIVVGRAEKSVVALTSAITELNESMRSVAATPRDVEGMAAVDHGRRRTQSEVREESDESLKKRNRSTYDERRNKRVAHGFDKSAEHAWRGWGRAGYSSETMQEYLAMSEEEALARNTRS